MPYIPPSVVREVKRMDLLTYLKNYEPYELVHFSGNTYTTRTHDSLKISNGKWMWWSQRTGGRSALDYLIKVRGYSFLEAVELLAERANIQPPLSVSENASLVEAMGGEVVRIAAGSRDHINAMDMVDGYGDGGDPVIEKSQFILSLFEQLDKKGINAKERSIIDRCVGEVYEEYQHGGAVPTLRVLREKFLEQEEPEAQDLALVSELFTNGSLDAFAHESNVDVNNRIMVYDILDLGKQLKTMGLLVITDAMLNRVTENWKQGKRTHIFLDEFHVVFENEYSGAFFNSAWRRFRKRNAFPTAITQNVEYLLDSVLASTMISNSEYIVMLNQAEPDRAKLATLLNISTEQMGYITNADAGCGLVKYGSSFVPFVNRFPTNTRLYKLMTTKPGEDSINRGRM